jgi:anti-sigma factor RsiW
MTFPLDRQILDDLVTLYLSGEASPATRALVEAEMASDPRLARVVADARQAGELPPPPPPRPGAEMASLRRTRELMRSRTQTLAVALIFTVLPLSFTFGDSGITFFVLRDSPKVAVAWWGTAAVLWVSYAVMRWRLRGV